MSFVSLKIGLTGWGQLGRLSGDGLASLPGAPRDECSTGKALTTASAAKPERAAKREKRIVIKLRIGKLGVMSSNAWWFGDTFIPFGKVVNAQYRLTEKTCSDQQHVKFLSLNYGTFAGL